MMDKKYDKEVRRAPFPSYGPVDADPAEPATDETEHNEEATGDDTVYNS